MADPLLERAQVLLARAHAANGRRAPDTALRFFRRLDALLDEAPDAGQEWATLRVRGLIGQASAVVERDGDADAAIGLLGAAREVAQTHGDRAALCVVLGQTATVQTRLGQFEMALKSFDAALALDPGAYDAALLRLNRGSAAVEVGRLVVAEADFELAAQSARELGYSLLEGMARHNAAYSKFLRGDLPGALRGMDDAADLVPEDVRAVGYLDRARVLLDAGLLTDADVTLQRAATIVRASRMTRDLAEIELMRARVLIGLRQYGPSAVLARSARRRFARMGSEPWVLRCELAALESRHAALRAEPTPGRAAWRAAAGAARSLAERAGAAAAVDAGVALQARLLMAEATIATGDVPGARAELDALPRRLTGASLPVRLQLQTLRAQLAFAEGKRSAGLRAVHRGFEVLKDHRSRVGAIESVTAAAVHGVHLSWVDVDAALATGRPAAVFDALERGRATFAGAARVQPPDDPVAADLVGRARGAFVEAQSVPPDAGVDRLAERDALLAHARRLQSQARERAWGEQGDAVVADAVTCRELVALLRTRADGAVVASYAMIGRRLYVVRVAADGTTILDLGAIGEVEEQVRRVRADLLVESNELIPHPMRAVAHGSLVRGLAWLDERLVEPLCAGSDLFIAARAPLVGLPWSALASRRGRRTGVNSLVARGREPRRAAPARETRVLVAAGPGVAHGADEARSVADVWPDALLLLGDVASSGRVREAFGSYDVVHLAAHGIHEADNPLFARIGLADGPLFAHELDGMSLPGSVVVLSACEVGAATPRIGGEVLGLTSILLRQGARAVVASVSPLSDSLAAKVMPSLHSELRATDDPESALAVALADVDEPVPLVCFSSFAGLARA